MRRILDVTSTSVQLFPLLVLYATQPEDASPPTTTTFEFPYAIEFQSIEVVSGFVAGDQLTASSLSFTPEGCTVMGEFGSSFLVPSKTYFVPV
jgi:hypothetical protein